MEIYSALLAFNAGNSHSPVNSPQKGQWRGALMFSVICAWINAWVNNLEAGDLRRHRAHYDVIVIINGVFTPVCHNIYRFSELFLGHTYKHEQSIALTEGFTKHPRDERTITPDYQCYSRRGNRRDLMNMFVRGLHRSVGVSRAKAWIIGSGETWMYIDLASNSLAI